MVNLRTRGTAGHSINALLGRRLLPCPHSRGRSSQTSTRWLVLQVHHQKKGESSDFLRQQFQTEWGEDIPRRRRELLWWRRPDTAGLTCGLISYCHLCTKEPAGNKKQTPDVTSERRDHGHGRPRGFRRRWDCVVCQHAFVFSRARRQNQQLAHLALQHSAAARAAELLQSLGRRSVEGFGQQEAEAARRQPAQTEHGERQRGVESPLQHTHTHTQSKWATVDVD